MKRYKTPLSWRLRRKQYLDEMRRRGLCLYCLSPNDRPHRTRCTACQRRNYVLQRIPKCRRLIEQYRRELERLLADDRAWKKAARREQAA